MKKITKRIIFVAAIALIVIGTISCANHGSPDDKDSKAGSFIDNRDGNIYNTIRIGNQLWMAENLNYDAGNGSWVYEDNFHAYATTYGRLYNWETACEVCPDGWHLPNEVEWTELIKYLGDENVAGGKMKERGIMHWYTPNEGATNISGFSALPGGFRDEYGSYFQMANFAGFWSSSVSDFNKALYWRLLYDRGNVEGVDFDIDYSFSVRCIKE